MHWSCQSDVIPWREGGREGGRERERGGGGIWTKKGEGKLRSTCTVYVPAELSAMVTIMQFLQPQYNIYVKSDIYMYMKHNTCTVGIN